MGTLQTNANLARPDDFYEALLAAHSGLMPEQSALLNAKLILLLANHIGDHDVLIAALAQARPDAEPAPKP
jgi:uncharacterized protein DUF2783